MGNISIAQEVKRNNNWAVGYSPTLKFDFNNGLNIDTITKASFYEGGSCISDTNGKFLFMFNGFYVFTPKQYYINDSLNCPYGTKLRTKNSGHGYWKEMSLILPKQDNQYYIISTGMSDAAYDDWQKPNANDTDFRFDLLSFHTVEYNSDTLRILNRNNILLENARLSNNRMKAVKHANGRDWWLIKPHKNQQKFYVFLVTSDNIMLFDSTRYDLEDLNSAIDGQSTFNENGDKYAFVVESNTTNVYMYDFDRCNGKFSNYQKFNIPRDIVNYPKDWQNGVAFSPNNRFLYVGCRFNTYQIDLQDTGITKIQQVGYPDTTDLNYFQIYMNLKLAPNGKIYIGNENATSKTMSYIDSPNNKGQLCSFKPRGLRQNFTYLYTPPNMPNYGLGVLKGSLCDSLTPQIDSSKWALYPNPVKTTLTIECLTKDNPQIKATDVWLYNAIGQLVYHKTHFIDVQRKIYVPVNNLSDGIYTIKVQLGTNRFLSKFIRL